MSLSDEIFDKDSESGGRWQPLVTSLLEKVEAKDAIGSSARQKKDRDFKKIYEYNPENGNSEEFTLIYNREEERNAIRQVTSDINDVLKKESKQFAADNRDKEQAGAKEKSHEPSPVDSNSIELLEKEAYEKGFAQGKKDGFQSGANEAAGIVNHLNGILTEVQHLWQNVVKKYEKEILDLVCHAVEKIVYAKVSVDNDIVRKVILDAFEKIPHPIDVTININPDDYDYIETVKEDFFSQVKGLKHVVVVADPSVDRGGCKVKTRSGEVNTNVFDRLEAIKKSIMAAAGES